MALTGTQYVSIAWLLVFLSLILVSARIGLRLYEHKKIYIFSDVFLVLAFLCLVTTAICDTYCFTTPQKIDDFFNTDRFVEWQYAAYFMFDMGLYLPKFSLLCFYFTILPTVEPRLKVPLRLVTVFTVCCFTTTILLDFFACGGDVAQNWRRPPPACTIATSEKRVYITWPLNITSELLLFVLPLPLLRLKLLQKREKIGLACIFLLGLITITVSTARFAAEVQSINTFGTIALSTSEAGVGILVVSLPALRPLLRKVTRSRRLATLRNSTVDTYRKSVSVA